MAKLYIFGIGGTGARVLRSFTMLMAAGVKTGAYEIVPIIIDPDKANADLTRAVDLMQKYRNIRSYLNFTKPEDEDKFFRKALLDVLPNYTLRIEGTEDKTFQQFIDLSSMDKSSQAMMRMLFSEKNLSSSMDVGFKGNPNVGSVVLNQIVNSPDFEEFANNFESEDKIFIISSIFGGTGASGFPLLLKTLRKGNGFKNHDIINKAEIGAITVLPYFKLKNDEESEIESSTFISKAKSALAYYENNIGNNNSINALYYLADDISNIYENHEGGEAQKNNAHLIEFLAATAIVDFSNKKHDGTINKELGLRDMKSEAVTFASFYENQKEELFNPLTKFTLMAICFENKSDYFTSRIFNANREFNKDFYNSSFFKDNFKPFTEKYLEWLREMEGNKRSLKLFNLSVKDKPSEVVVGDKLKLSRKWGLIKEYYLIADRLNGAVNKCKIKDQKVKFLEMFNKGLSEIVDKK
jgi:hypothetical protein